MDKLPDMKIVARIRSDFTDKFGIPRQSGLVEGLVSRVVFEPDYREREALRGIEGYSHLWLLWVFSENRREATRLTVRPPRLGGNKRMGVFATRSPYRPNPIGLSCVKLLGVESDPKRGSVLKIAGADLMDGTPIFDIKPYIPYTDAIPDASAGYTARTILHELSVEIPEELLARVPEEKREALLGVLENDPRPTYQNDPGRVYGMAFGGHNVKFTVEGGLLRVCAVEKIK